MSRANQRKLYGATTDYINNPAEDTWARLKHAFGQEEFDRMEVETKPAPEAEQPALELEDAGE
jgi:hypothetical protein